MAGEQAVIGRSELDGLFAALRARGCDACVIPDYDPCISCAMYFLDVQVVNP